MVNKDSIQLPKELKQEMYHMISQMCAVGNNRTVKTPANLIEHLIKQNAQQAKDITALSGSLQQARKERDEARSHIFEQFDRPAGEVRTVPASGKLSIEKHAGKKVSITVIE